MKGGEHNASGDPVFQLARGRPTRQSGGAGDWALSGAAVTGEPTGRFSFCTDVETDPWWQVDLGAVMPIGRIVVWNRDDAGLPGAASARPLHILLSDDAVTWRTIASSRMVFGGRSHGSPLVVLSLLPLHGRHVRIQLQGEGKQLHLDQVEVQLSVPPLRWAALDGVRLENEVLRGRARHTHDSGFFSNSSTTLETLVHLAAWGILPDAPDCSSSYTAFREPLETLDVHGALFEHHPEVPLPPRGEIPDPFALFYAGHHHLHYRDRDFARIVPFIDRYFRPSASVRGEAARLRAAAGYDPARTVALCWRGTDKHLEVPPTDVGDYIALADRLLSAGEVDRVLIQTDQAQAREAVRDYFGERCVFFADLPVSSGDRAMHQTDLSGEHAMSRSDFARRLVAAVHLVAQARHVVTHTGNVGLWIALFRGSAERLWQFDRDCKLVEPG